jgi:hypothetical protein
MTGPFPGQGDDTPQQQAGGTPVDGDGPNPYFGDADEDLPPIGTPPRGPNRKVIIAIAVAVVVIVGAGLGLWFGVGPGKTGGTAVAATGSRHPAPVGQPASGSVPPTPPSGGAPATTTPNASGTNPAAAYDVGMCFDEVNGTQAAKVELNPVQCGGADAVFVINDVVASIADCDTGQGSADYHNHGYQVPDDTAGVAYCASLVVPANDCFVLGGTAPIARAACGSAPDVVQVQAIESAPTAATACTDKTNPDIWFYQSPTSGQFACVSRPSTANATTPTTPDH